MADPDVPESREELKRSYGRFTARRLIFIAAFVVVVVVLFFVSLTVGTRDLSVSEVFDFFIRHLQGVTYDRYTDYVNWFDDSIVWNYRVPRAIFAIIAGAGLAVAGATMQSVMKNPLADPYTTGISSGALLGVALAMVLGFSAGSGGIDGYGTVLNAMIFSMIPVVVIYLLSPFLNRSPATLILAGTAVSYLFSSITSVLLVSTDAETLAGVYRWQVGSFDGLQWDSIAIPLAFCAVGSAVVMYLSGKLNVMSLDDKDARALGLDSERLRLVCLIVLAFMASSITAFAGIIGFVGLIVPHMVRLLIGADNRYLIPASIAFGAAFMLFCDIVARAVDVSAAVPVGVVVDLIGAPVFLYIILSQRRGVWRRRPTGSATPSGDTARRGGAGRYTP